MSCMTSMIQMCPPHEQNIDDAGYITTNAAWVSSHLAFNGRAAPVSCTDHKLIGGAYSMWEPSKLCPPMHGPLAGAAPLTFSSHAAYCTQQDDLASNNNTSKALTTSINAADVSLFSNVESFHMDFQSVEENQLIELMGLQRKTSLYGGYGDDEHDRLSQVSGAAEDDAEQQSFVENFSCADIKVKVGNLGRTMTFPPAGRSARRSRAAGSSACCTAASAPLLPSFDADIRGNNDLEKRFNLQQLMCREKGVSSAGTRSWSDDHAGGELRKGKDVGLKIEGMEVSHCKGDQQGGNEQVGIPSSSKTYKQNKRRNPNTGNSNASVKAACLDTLPDVVHVRARRGQATDSHSLAERVRREKISQRMKVLQEIVPGCHKVLGKAMMLDEIINYVQSLQKQVEFLSMKLAVANQVGTPPTTSNEVKFLLPNMEVFGLFGSSFQTIQTDSSMQSLIQ